MIANLAGCDRRAADWRGFLDFVRSLEPGSNDVLNVVRRLQLLVKSDVNIPRPALASGNAVSLMTIHAAKGLEWSVVVVPDLTRQANSTSAKIYADPQWGVGLSLTDEAGKAQDSALHTLLKQQQKTREQEESKRVLYVALTRARDHLILTAAGDRGGGLELLQPGLAGQYPVEAIAFDPDRAMPLAPVAPDLPVIPTKLLLHSAGSGLAELPVTAFTEYDQCPKRFKFRYVDGHPGLNTGMAPTFAAEIGTLTHKALELQLRDETELTKFSADLPEVAVQDSWNLMRQFRDKPVYADYQKGEWEQSIRLQVGKIIWNGVIDLLGNDFVLDVKTDQEIDPYHHRLQLWAYAKATGKETAHLAYLRHDVVYTFGAAELIEIEQEAEAIAQSIAKSDFQSTPSHQKCGKCSYSEICESNALEPAIRS